MPSPEHGSIVWAMVADPNGHKKRRPVVILTPTKEIIAGASLVGVAVTSTPTIPKPPLHVELPWHSDKHEKTGLFRKSWAICTWIVKFKFEEIEKTSPGPVPESHLILINSFVLRLKTN